MESARTTNSDMKSGRAAMPAPLCVAGASHPSAGGRVLAQELWRPPTMIWKARSMFSISSSPEATPAS